MSRKAISRWRAPALASIRFARFAHAMSNTSPEMESSTQSGSAYCFRSGEAPVAAGSAFKREPQIILPGGRVVLRRESGGINARRDCGELRGSSLKGPPRIEAADRRQPPGCRAGRPRAFSVNRRFAAKGQGNIEVATYFKAVKSSVVSRRGSQRDVHRARACSQ